MQRYVCYYLTSFVNWFKPICWITNPFLENAIYSSSWNTNFWTQISPMDTDIYVYGQTTGVTQKSQTEHSPAGTGGVVWFRPSHAHLPHNHSPNFSGSASFKSLMASSMIVKAWILYIKSVRVFVRFFSVYKLPSWKQLIKSKECCKEQKAWDAGIKPRKRCRREWGTERER